MATINGKSTDELLIGTDDADTITGMGGFDVISGEGGNDTIYGDGSLTSREFFAWSKIEHPDGPSAGHIDDEDAIPGGITQNTGGVDVTFSYHAPGIATEFEGDAQVVGGIDSAGLSVNANSSMESTNGVDGATATYGFEFSNPVANIDFHVNDIDVDSVVTILAFDTVGDALPVQIELAHPTELSLSDDGGVLGNDNKIETGLVGTSSPNDPHISALVQVAGPAARIEINHTNEGGDNSAINVTDIFYDTIDIAPMGDDTLVGGAGDDMLFGGGAVDTLVGGDGADTMEGGSCDDDLIVGGGDVASGDGGDDEFIIDMSATGADPITIIGGETDENAIIDGTNNAYAGAPNVDGDIIDLRYVDLVSFNPAGGDPASESGSFVYRNDQGDHVTVHYSEIENVLLPPVDRDMGDLGPVDGEDDGEVMSPGYNDANAPTDGGGDVIDGADGPNDVVYGNGGDDDIDAGLGDDIATGDAGNDTLDGNVGNDLLFGGGGSDSLVGGQGKDKIFGGSDDDTLVLASGDLGLGGGGDDVFMIDASNPDSGSPITIIGGETDEGGADTTNDHYPGAQNPVGDVLDIRGLNLTSFDPTNGDPTSESGRFSYINDDGEEITVVYSEIENVICCFTRGTMIQTDRGDVAIEDLEIGDLIETRDNGLQPLRWMGARAVPATGKLAPIVFRKGVLGNTRDIRVSPQHRMLIEGWRAEMLFGEEEVLAAAKHLVNGDTIFADAGGEVEYFHLLFDQHQLVMGNGCWSESFHPGEEGFDALSNAAREEIFELFPELRNDMKGYGDTNRMTLKAGEARILAENPDIL